MVSMKTPPHPGAFVFDECIELVGLTITEAAHTLGVTRFRLAVQIRLFLHFA